MQAKHIGAAFPQQLAKATLTIAALHLILNEARISNIALFYNTYASGDIHVLQDYFSRHHSLASSGGFASAAVIDSANSGLANPDQTINFSEVAGLMQDDIITNEFAALGVTF